MTDKANKKDTKAKQIEQWADTSDNFVNLIYKKLRNKNKKLDKIEQTQDKIRKGEIKPNEEQKEMLTQKETIKQEMKDLEKIITMYKQAFPDNPAFLSKKKKN